ncbi:MAG: alpha-ketoacid dehydrogenase subunit beta [Alphaproteobacteria bacterium]
MPESVSTMTALRTISMADAIREGLTEAAKRDPSVIFFAEGVADPAAVYGTLKGIGSVIGHERMIEMPVAEAGLCGVAIGAALSGKRPVISFHRVEFALLAMEQIVNNAAKTTYISGGRHHVPIVLRLVVGRGWGQGPEHSQSLETMFSYFPGLKVVMPTYPADTKGMVVAAVEDNNPVILIEHRWCHYVQGHVPEGYYREAIDGPRTIRQGKDITIVATSYMVLEAMRAATALAALGVDAEVIDLRVLRPMALAPVLASVRRTGRLLTVDTGFKTLGIGAEVVAETTAKCFAALKAAPQRIGLPDHPLPSSRGLIRGLYPDSISIMRTISEMLKLPAEREAQAEAELAAQRGNLPIDVPDPFFKGPF